MLHLGDITKINGADIPPVDIITAGSPCQDFSIAHGGEREGLQGQRSGLFFEMIRVIKEMREHDKANGRADDDLRPRLLVWENVPGVLSAGKNYKGEDFRIVLEEIARIADPDAVIPRPSTPWSPSGAIMGSNWSLAWRVTDSQYWGVPQRRRRISVVGDFNGHRAAPLLFECESVSGDSDESGEEGEGSPRRTSEGVGTASSDVTIVEERSQDGVPRVYENGINPTLNTYGGGRECLASSGEIMVEMTSTKNTIVTDGISPTLTQRMGTGGNQVNAVLQQVSERNIY